MVGQRLLAAPLDREVEALARELGYRPDADWGWQNYKSFILTIALKRSLTHHLEIGAGRNPLFTLAELTKFKFDVTINDISQRELDLAGSGYSHVQCDIASEHAVSALGLDRFDFAYCFMVMEHVRDVRRMWQNVHDLLVPGGVALSFFPTLYAPPFVINRLLPERFATGFLRALFPDRREESVHPKFPAYYNYCRSSDTVLPPLLQEIGFSSVTILPFYGYNYFAKIPVLGPLDSAFTRIAREKGWRALSSYAYAIAIK